MMRMLFLAPQPFYQERGSPIAIKLVLEVLSQRGVKVDVLTYHEGEDVFFDGVALRRTPGLVHGIRPGFSWKKLVCDGFMTVQALQQCLRQRYDMVQAVEESVFIALLLKALFGIPYVYDMDSSLPEQLIEKNKRLRFLLPFMRTLEGLAVRHAEAVVPVCEALAETARQHHPKRVVVLHDVPLAHDEVEDGDIDDLRGQISGCLAMYVGNLEPYQGIDLLLESFALAQRYQPQLRLVIIGGRADDIAHYKDQCAALGISEQTFFLGPRPVAQLGRYLAQADVLVSPRISGNNTPMKIYSYLQSGKPIVATNLKTHTQVLTRDIACLTEPTAAAFAEGLALLAADPALRAALGSAGKRHVTECYSYASFHRVLSDLIASLQRDALTPRIKERT
ncbi:MAG: glycosyltransferase [Aggregatilineales bacterium]